MPPGALRPPAMPLLRPPGDAAWARTDESASGGRRRLLAVAPGRLGRPRRRGDAEADDEVEVEGDQPDDRPGQEQNVQRVEAAERVAADLRAAAQERREKRAEERRGAVDVDPDDGGPVGGLVVGEQVAGEALEQRDGDEQHADDPVQLAWV